MEPSPDSARTPTWMIGLLYALIVSSFVCDFRELRLLGLGPLITLFGYVPEAISALMLVGLVIGGSTRKRIVVPPAYLVVGSMFVAVCAAGIILNRVPEGTVAMGLRIYFRSVPAFLFPLVFPVSQQHLSRILMLVVSLALLQLPISLFQRFTNDVSTGDVVRGTFGSGAIMSIILVGVVVGLFAFYLRGRISLKALLALAPLLIVPTLINETKGTVVILPFALLSVVLCAGRGSQLAPRLKAGAFVLGFLALFGVGFAATYGALYGGFKHGSSGFVEYFLEGGAIRAVYKPVDDQGPDDGKAEKLVREYVDRGRAIGRLDALVLAHHELGEDPFTLMLGKGIGNVSNPTGAWLLRGEYAQTYQNYGVNVTTVTGLLWETGVFGLIIAFMTLAIILRDARHLSNLEGTLGAFGLAWVGITVLIAVSMLYKDMIHHYAVSFTSLFFTGVVVSHLQPSARSNAPAESRYSSVGVGRNHSLGRHRRSR